MGTLRDFDLSAIDCDVFFETGTGLGYSLAYALAAESFSQLFSVEIDKDTFERTARLFSVFPRLSLINSDSQSALTQVLPAIDDASRVLFFLDAHFPGEVSAGFAGYKAVADKTRRLPLEVELEIINSSRPSHGDVIIIDDLRIYENGPFESGNTPDWAETLAPEEKNIDFVDRIFPNRVVQRDYRREGYLIIR